MKKTLFIIVSVSILIISLSLAYYLLIFIPRSENRKLSIEEASVALERDKQRAAVAQKEKESEAKVKETMLLQTCLKRVSDNYTSNWNSGCSKLGLKEECTLPKTWADTYTEGLEREKEGCYKSYGSIND